MNVQGARGDSGAVAVDVHSTSGGDNQDSSDNDDDGAGNNVGTTKGTSEGSGGGSDNDSDGGSNTDIGHRGASYRYSGCTH